jgi:hypothetical protein
MGIALIYRRDLIKEIVQDFIKNPALILFSGVIALLGGLLIVLSHNVWEWSWRVLPTLIGYLLIWQGLTRIFFPEWVITLSKKLSTEKFYTITGLVLTLLGLFMAYKGFWG